MRESLMKQKLKEIIHGASQVASILAYTGGFALATVKRSTLHERSSIG